MNENIVPLLLLIAFLEMLSSLLLVVLTTYFRIDAVRIKKHNDK